MKMLLKRGGIILIIAGVLILFYSEFSKLESNSLLIISAVLIAGGLVTYIILNNLVE